MSALFGQPPATDEDYWIVRALILQLSATKPELAATLDPRKGWPLVPKRTLGYVGPELAQTTFAAGVTVAVICFCITALRLILRRLVWKMKLFADEWIIIPGTVSVWTPKSAAREASSEVVDEWTDVCGLALATCLRPSRRVRRSELSRRRGKQARQLSIDLLGWLYA